jgi:hypothetical protein
VACATRPTSRLRNLSALCRKQLLALVLEQVCQAEEDTGTNISVHDNLNGSSEMLHTFDVTFLIRKYFSVGSPASVRGAS